MGDETSLRDEISFLRQMAESGRRGPILGGIFLAVSGAVFGLACFLDAARQFQVLPVQLTMLQIWLGAAAVFAAFWLVMVLRMRKNKPIALQKNATFGTIWSACGLGVMVCFLTTELISRNLHSELVLAGYVPVIFAFYGTAWFASASLARKNWMYVAGVASFLHSFAMALLITTPWMTTGMGVGLLLLLTLPGAKLVQDEARS